MWLVACRNEIEQLQRRVQAERERYQTQTQTQGPSREASAAAAAVSALPLFAVHESFVLERTSALYELSVELQAPIDIALVQVSNSVAFLLRQTPDAWCPMRSQSDVPLELLDKERNSAVLSYTRRAALSGLADVDEARSFSLASSSALKTPARARTESAPADASANANANALLATFRCQANTMRLELGLRSVESSRAGCLSLFLVPRLTPRIAQVSAVLSLSLIAAACSNSSLVRLHLLGNAQCESACTSSSPCVPPSSLVCSCGNTRCVHWTCTSAYRRMSRLSITRWVRCACRAASRRRTCTVGSHSRCSPSCPTACTRRRSHSHTHRRCSSSRTRCSARSSTARTSAPLAPEHSQRVAGAQTRRTNAIDVCLWRVRRSSQAEFLSENVHTLSVVRDVLSRETARRKLAVSFSFGALLLSISLSLSAPVATAWLGPTDCRFQNSQLINSLWHYNYNCYYARAWLHHNPLKRFGKFWASWILNILIREIILIIILFEFPR